jgi:hypothetical protein
MKKIHSVVLVSLGAIAAAAAAACGNYAAAGGTGGSTSNPGTGGSINDPGTGGATNPDSGGSINNGTGGSINNGTGGSTTGGVTGTTGGATASGGGTASGGATASGGSTASGGRTAAGGTTASGGTGGSTSVAAGPCDVLKAAGNPCVAAHSTVRALSSAYNGNLYQVKNASGTKDIPVLSPGGYANAAVQDQFCTAACTISIIYDQSGKGNDVTPAPAGGAKPTADLPANAADLKITAAGHSVYGVLIKPGMGYRKLVANGTAINDDPETQYMVSSQQNLVNGCCFDYGNAETDAHDDGNGTMEAVYLGLGVIWGTGVQGGPWVMSDLENGLYAGWENGQDKNISTNTPLKFDFVTALIVGYAMTAQTGGRFANYGGDATTGTLKTMYDGIRPAKTGYVPMHKQGSVILGIGGDNSASGGGRWYEGVMATGAATKATVDAVQANIVAAGYGK